MNLRVFIFVYHNVLCLLGFQAYTQTFEWKVRVCELLAILKGDTHAN